MTMRLSSGIRAVASLALLLMLQPALMGQAQRMTRTNIWPSYTGVPKVGDTLSVGWARPAYEYTSAGMRASMQLRFDHTDRMAARAMDVEVVIEAKAVVNRDLDRYDKRSDRDSLFTLNFRIGKRSQGVGYARNAAPDSLLDPSLDMRDRQLFACINAHRFTYRLVRVVVNEGSGNREVSELPQGVKFEAELEWSFTPKINPAHVPAPYSPVAVNCTGNISGFDELILSWTAVTGAVGYHLEWTWADDYDPVGTGTILPDYDLERNATRVSLDPSATRYRLPLLFDRGWIVYRVRAMGELAGPPPTPIYGTWSLAQATGNVANVPAVSKFQVATHQGDVNWQLTTSFAEEGKRKEVMTYADGTLRSRQAVTRNNSLYVPILGETFYDAVGRPAVESMPVPMVRDKECPTVMGSDDWAPIDLYPRFNNADEDADPVPEDYQYFHMLPSSGNCVSSAVPFHPQDGAELFYHSDHLAVNDALTGKPGFLPKSFGFPFTQTEFSRDNTGRVRRKSGVGETFRLGTGHETVFLYGKPEQIKLDRLFGSEAGYATHYQKNVVLDANGQASVSYLDRAGRTVATALAGAARQIEGVDQLEPLLSLTAPPTLHTDLFCGQPSLECEANNLMPDVPALVFTDQIVVPANGLTYLFQYGMQPGIATDPCLAENICLNCVYELTISLVDACGVPVISESTVIGQFEESPDGALVFADCGTAPDWYAYNDPDLSVQLDAGEYTLTKILRVSQDARDTYVQFLLANGVTHLNADCYTPLSEFESQFLGQIDYSDCEIDCEDCVEALGTLDEFLLAGGSEQEFNQLLDECNAPCQADSWCDVAYQAMLVDMTLGGQYAGITVDGNGNTTADDRTSVFYHGGPSDPSILLSRGYDWSFDHYEYTPAGFQDVTMNEPIWRQPRLFENGGFIHEYRGESGERFRIPVELIDDEWSPAVEHDNEVFADGGGNFTYPENLATLDLFISYWQPGFEKSLLFYHPEFCYWLNCRGYAEVISTDTWSSDDFDEALVRLDFVDPVDFFLRLAELSWFNPGAPSGERMLIYHDQANPSPGGAFPSGGKHDPFARNAAYDPFAGQLLDKVAQYKQIGTEWYSMEEFAAIMGFCTTIPTQPIDPSWEDFLGTAVPDDVKQRQWSAFKSFYFSEKYRAQKRRADAAVSSCTSACSSLNYCIGQGEDDSWVGRMQAPVMQLHPHYWPTNWINWPWLEPIYEHHQEIYSQLHGRPYVQGCQLCNETNHEFFVDKVPRVPDPEQFPGMNMTPDEMAYQNYMATGDCPVAAAWRALIEERAIEDQLASTGVALDTEPGWAGLVIAQDGQGAPIPPATWDGIIAGNTLNISVNGCLASLTLSNPSILTTYAFADYAAFLDAVFAAPGIEALTATTFTLHVQFMDNAMNPHATTLTGTVCGFYDLITCTFPPVGTGNQLAADFSDLLTAIASADGDLLEDPSVNLATTPTTQAVPAGGGFPGVPAGPMIQTQVPDAFTTVDWNEDLIWSYDGTSTFTLASGTDNCPRYEIQILNYEQAPGSTWTPADWDDVFSFGDMVSAGFNLFDVNIYSEPDWANEIPPQLLATVHGSVTFFPCVGGSEEPSLGGFGYPGGGLCGDDAALMVSLQQAMGYYITLPQLGLNHDLAANPFTTDELRERLYDVNCGGGPCPILPLVTGVVNYSGGPVVDENAYKMISFGSLKCPVLYLPIGLLNGTAQTNPWTFDYAMEVLSPDANGFSNAFQMFVLDQNGAQVNALPVIVYAPCMSFELCNPCPLDGPFDPSVPPTSPGTAPCGDLADDLFDALEDFNASAYSAAYSVDLDTSPEALNLCITAGIGPCFGAYLAYLQPYIDWDPSQPALDSVVSIDDWEGCTDCPEVYQEYLAAVAEFEAWVLLHNPLIGPPPSVQIANEDLFTSGLLCNCAPGYLAGLEHAMLDDELSMAEIDDASIWSLYHLGPGGSIIPNCIPPDPCEPEFPPPTPYIDPPEGCACCDGLEANAITNANQAYAQQIADLAVSLGNAYNADCINALEAFTMEFQDPEHHYTLYYYDQAGNLVRTVPPEGVEQLDIGVVPVGGGTPSGQPTIAAIANDRATGSRSVFMDHRMPSDHLYNSLNNPIRLAMPDHDRMNIWESTLPTGLPHDLRVTGSHFLGNRGYLSGWRDGPSNRTRGYVYSTTDGGRSWQRSYGLVAAHQRAVHFGTGSIGYSVGEHGSILRSEDGGSSWDLMTELTNRNAVFRDVDVSPGGTALVVGHPLGQNSPVAFKIAPDQTISNAGLTNMSGYQFSALRGWDNGGSWWWYATINDVNNGTVAYATSNGNFNGATNVITMGSRAAMTTGHATGTGTTAFVAGESGALLRTTDAGNTWKYVKSGTKDDFVKVHFIDDNVGLALMNTPTGVLRWTNNGGQTWVDVAPVQVGLRDFHWAGSSGGANEFFAVGDDNALVRVLLTPTSAAVHAPVPGPTGQLRSVHADRLGAGVFMLIGREDGTVVGTPDLFASTPVWTSVALAGSNAVKDLVAHRPTANPSLRHALFLSENGRLYQGVFDISAQNPWGTIHQFTFTGTRPYKAIALRTNGSGMAVVSQVAAPVANLGRIELVNLEVLQSGFMPQLTAPALTSQSPDIRCLFTLGGASDVVMSVGMSTGGNAGQRTGIYRSIISGTGPHTTTLADGRLSIRGALRLNNYARQIHAACGEEGTISAPHPGVGAIQWYVTKTPVLTNLNGIAAYGNNSGIIAVGDGGMVFTMLPHQPATFTQLTVPTTADLKDVAVIGNAITIAGVNGLVLHCADFSQDQTFQVLQPVGGDINGLIVKNGEVVAVGANGLVHRLFGAQRLVVNEVFTPRLNDVHFANPNQGYAVGANQVARYSTNGGVSWSVVDIMPQITVAYNSSSSPPTKSFTAVHNNAPGMALAVGTSNLSAKFTGTSWTVGDLPTTPVIHYRDVIATPSGAQVVVGNATTAPVERILARTPTNPTWAAPTGLPAANANGMYALYAWPAYFDAVTGTMVEDVVAGGDNGQVRHMRYNGVSWSGQNAGISGLTGSTNIRALWFHDRTMGLAAGSGGAIYRSSAATTNNHSTIGWVPAAEAISAVQPLFLGQGTQASATISTIGFADRHRGFIGGTYAGAPPGFARALHDESGLYSQRYWYDQLGRVILSQNTKQFNAEPRRYSYTLYDELGRVHESGELHDVSSTLPGIFGMNVNGMFKPEVIDYSTFLAWVDPNDERYEVVRTQYDEAFNDPTIHSQFTNGQQNLRLRVAHSTYAEKIPDDRDVLTYEHASHYSYDIHGNLNELVQEHRQLADDAGDFLAGFKRLKYTYDLISGNVKQVAYQDGAPDQFHHRYTYDADNRIVTVETSRNDDISAMWRTDARYFYYPHGPLERVEIGDLKVQGMDYAYTLQGWLKGINSDLLLPDKDIGQDAAQAGPHPLVGRDAYGLSLGYYGETDYVAIDDSRWSTSTDYRPYAPTPASQMSGDLKQLYNGNIAHTVNSLVPFTTGSAGYTGAVGELGQPLAMVYKYDQLNRLKRARGYTGLQAANKWEGANDPVADRYLSKYEYDANGNIGRTERWDHDGTWVDRMAYSYHDENNKRQRNRLYHVRDDLNNGADYPVNQTPYEIDPELMNDPAGNSNYIYDAIGNLVMDKVNEIEEITWTATGKVREIGRPVGSTAQHLAFAYDALGHTREKIILDENASVIGRIHYVRDARGDIMATYRYDTNPVTSLDLIERPIYGCQRLGTDNYKQQMRHPVPLYNNSDNPLGLVQYEIKDQLGSVTTTVTDELVQVDEGQDSNTANDYYAPVVVSAQGYEPFGALLSGRSYNSAIYAYLFQGQEHHDEINGGFGTSYSFEYRVHDARVGRFFSLDPLATTYPYNSPYAFSENRVIDGVELEGLEVVKIAKFLGKKQIKAVISEYVEKEIKARLVQYHSKAWAKQMLKDADEIVGLMTNEAWWEWAIEFTPYLGDVYGTLRLGHYHTLLSNIAKKAEWASNIARHGDGFVKAGLKRIDDAIEGRGKLRKALKADKDDIVMELVEAHHIIPIKALKHNEVVQTAVAAGWDINAATNGMLLDTETHRTGGHKKYNKWILGKLDDWAAANKGYSAQDAVDYLDRLIPEAKKYIKTVTADGKRLK